MIVLYKFSFYVITLVSYTVKPLWLGTPMACVYIGKFKLPLELPENYLPSSSY